MKYVTVLFVLLSLTGCAVGPKYQRPDMHAPAAFRAPEPLPPDQAASIADAAWFDVFKDDQLQGLIRAALANNFDLREAVARVDAARAIAGITRSNQYPNFGASAAVDINRLSRDGATKLPETVLPDQNRKFGSAGLNLF